MTGAIAIVPSDRSMGSAIVSATKVKADSFAMLKNPIAARPPQSPVPQSTHRSEWRKVPASSLFSPLPSPGDKLSEPEASQTKQHPEPATRTLEPHEVEMLLRLIHADACNTFETVLGPHANAAHRDHFHLDMKKRRYVKICN